MSQYDYFQIDLDNEQSTHTQLIRLAGENKRILDVGCAGGLLARVLKEKFNCEITGIELDHESGAKAAEHCKRVIIADLDQVNLLEHFSPGEFDVALLADVLEHLKNPGRILSQLFELVGEYVVISVPNVTHSAILYELLQGKFDYRELGLLDRTHLRFFTRDSILKLIEDAGFIPDRIQRTLIPAPRTEFASDTSRLPPEVCRAIEARDEADTYQFIIRARKPQLAELIGVNGEADVDALKNLLIEKNRAQAQLETELATLRKKVAVIESENSKLARSLDWYNAKLRTALASQYELIEQQNSSEERKA